MNVKIKLCGITRLEDALGAAAAGAHAIGLNFVPSSPRCLIDRSIAGKISAAAKQRGLKVVGVCADMSLPELEQLANAVPLDALQLHGHEHVTLGHALRGALPLKEVWKAYRVAGREDLARIDAEQFPCAALLLDAKAGSALGGTGQTFDWNVLKSWQRSKQLVLAGGLTPENVTEAVRLVRPDWVDTASGVEASPGIKSQARMEAFVQAALEA